MYGRRSGGSGKTLEANIVYVCSEDVRTLGEGAAVAVAAGERAECACAAWPRRQPAPHEILRPKPRRYALSILHI
ncbi:unnamed protein product, partial [Brenthis ino]